MPNTELCLLKPRAGSLVTRRSGPAGSSNLLRSGASGPAGTALGLLCAVLALVSGRLAAAADTTSVRDHPNFVDIAAEPPDELPLVDLNSPEGPMQPFQLRIVPGPGGAIYVAGPFDRVNGEACSELVRLTAEGERDRSFRWTLPGLVVRRLWAGDSGAVLCETTDPDRPGEPASLLRLLPDGTRDPGFRFALGGAEYIANAFEDADGAWLIAEGSGDNGGRLLRVRRDGSPDPDFQSMQSELGVWSAVVRQSDGRILLAGSEGLRRLLPNGSPDPTFHGARGRYYSILPLPDGRFIAGGSVQLHGFGSDGELDPTLPQSDFFYCFNDPDSVHAPRLRVQGGRLLTSHLFNPFFDGLPLPGVVPDSGPGPTFWLDVTQAPRNSFLVVPGARGTEASCNGCAFAECGDSLFSPPPVAGTSEVRVTATIIRLGDSQTPQTLDFFTRDGTARAGLDYLATTGTVTFGSGEVEKVVQIPLVSGRDRPFPAEFRIGIRAGDASVPVSPPARVILAGKRPLLPGDLRVRRLGDGRAVIGFEFTKVADQKVSGSAFRLEVSDDLLRWTPGGLAGDDAGYIRSGRVQRWTWTDDGAANRGARFYRLVFP